MSKLKEKDDTIGKCVYCNKSVCRSDDWRLSQYGFQLCHNECDAEYMRRASQI